MNEKIYKQTKFIYIRNRGKNGRIKHQDTYQDYLLFQIYEILEQKNKSKNTNYVNGRVTQEKYSKNSWRIETT